MPGGEIKKLPIQRICDIRAKSRVRSKNPESGFEQDGTISDWFHYCVPASELIELELENSEVLKVTRNHEFYLKDGTKKLAGDLEPDDDLME